MGKSLLVAVVGLVAVSSAAWGQAPYAGYYPRPAYGAPMMAPPMPMYRSYYGPPPMAYPTYPPPWMMPPAYAPAYPPPYFAQPPVVKQAPGAGVPGPVMIEPPLAAAHGHHGHHQEPPSASCEPGTSAHGSHEVCPAPACEAPVKSHCGFRFYGRAEALFWWLEDQPAPTFLSVTPTGATTAMLIGSDGDLNLPGADLQLWGGRATLGFYLNCCNTCAIEGSFLYLAPRDESFTALAADNTIAATAPGGVAVAITGTGSATVSTWTSLIGADANLKWEVFHVPSWRLALLAGFRWLQLHENLGVTTVDGTGTTTADLFGTENHFFAGQLGLETEWSWRRFYINGWGKVALGLNRETVDILGNTVTAGVSTTGGRLATASNIGSYTNDSTAYLVEAGINVGFLITNRCRIFGGYNVFYMDNVVRPGSQIDVVNAAPVGGTNETSFWMQGVTAGLEFRY